MKNGNTIESIVAALAGNPSSTECASYHQSLDALRVDIAGQLTAIESHPHTPLQNQPRGYQDLFAKGAKAVTDERARLRATLAYLDEVGFAVNAALESALDRESLQAEPGALKRLPKLLAAVSVSHAQLLAAVAAANEAANLVAAAQFRHPKRPPPFSDTELAPMVALRNSLWQPINMDVVANIPFDPDCELAKSHPQTWAMLYERRGGATNAVISTRRPPSAGHPSDYSSPTYRGL